MYCRVGRFTNPDLLNGALDSISNTVALQTYTYLSSPFAGKEFFFYYVFTSDVGKQFFIKSKINFTLFISSDLQNSFCKTTFFKLAEYKVNKNIIWDLNFILTFFTTVILYKCEHSRAP